MSSSYNLQPGRRIVVKNGDLATGKTEPGVSVVAEELPSEEIFGGVMKRAVFGSTQFPPSNDNFTEVEAPGSGIVLPGGIRLYYLELAPGYTTPMHRTVSHDYMIVQAGKPVLITPTDSFTVVDGKGTYTNTQETVCQLGEVVVQAGSMHAWANKSDEWVRILCVVLDAKEQSVSNGSAATPLLESWLQ